MFIGDVKGAALPGSILVLVAVSEWVDVSDLDAQCQAPPSSPCQEGILGMFLGDAKGATLHA